jgi:hypothetical protein
MPKRVINAFFPGDEVIVHEGDVYADDHPYVKMYPSMFEELVVIEAPSKRRSAPVEQATAAPGEQRTTHK